MGERRHVLAGSYTEFTAWCFDNNVSPHNIDVMYVSSPEMLRGRRGGTLIAFGTWARRGDASEILEIAAHAGMA